LIQEKLAFRHERKPDGAMDVLLVPICLEVEASTDNPIVRSSKPTFHQGLKIEDRWKACRDCFPEKPDHDWKTVRLDHATIPFCHHF